MSRAPTDRTCSASTARPRRPPHPERRRWLFVNLSWVLAVAALSVTGVMCVVGSAQAWMLFYHGDTVFPALVAHDVFAGVPLHFAFSAVLFFPELAVYLAVAALHLGTQPTMVIVGVVWLFLIAVAIRLAIRWALSVESASAASVQPPSGSISPSAVTAVASQPQRAAASQPQLRSPRRQFSSIVGSFFAVVVLVVQIATEGSADPRAVEFASLATASTYYVSTILAMILSIGLIARAQGAPLSRMRGTVVAVVVVVAAATFVNPLFIAWFVVPTILALLTLVLLRRSSRRQCSVMVGVLLGSVALGMLARIPFSSWMAGDLNPSASPSATATAGLHPLGVDSGASSTPSGWWASLQQAWSQSIDVFRGSISANLDSVGGVVDLTLVILSACCAVAVTIIAYRARLRGMLTLGLVVLWIVPVTTVWPLVLATQAVRYWEAIEFAPLVAVAALLACLFECGCERVAVRGSLALGGPGERGAVRGSLAPGGPGERGLGALRLRRWGSVVCVVVCVASVLLAGGMSLRAVQSTADAANAASVSCVVKWVQAHPDEYGAGTYWSIRPAKAYVTNPSHLLQITVNFQSWRWLVNQEDFTHLTVRYLVRSRDDHLQMNELPEVLRSPPTVARCGSFSIQQLPQPLVITAYWGLQQD